MGVYIYTNIYVYIFICIYIYTHICLNIYMYEQLSVSLYTLGSPLLRRLTTAYVHPSHSHRPTSHGCLSRPTASPWWVSPAAIKRSWVTQSLTTLYVHTSHWQTVYMQSSQPPIVTSLGLPRLLGGSCRQQEKRARSRWIQTRSAIQASHSQTVNIQSSRPLLFVCCPSRHIVCRWWVWPAARKKSWEARN